MMNPPQWKRMLFKERKVYAQVNDQGSLVVQNGLVKIKYQLNQEKEYLAHTSSVKEIDEHALQAMESKKQGKDKTQTEPPDSSSPSLEEYDSQRCILVFTDGACEGNPGPAGIGVFLHYQNHKKELSRFIGHGTNNIAELTAIKVALQEIKDSRLPVIIFTDSSYCYGVLTGTAKAKKNQALVAEIKKEIARFSFLKFRKVAGHKGIEGNERANLLAQQAISKHKKDSLGS